MSIIPTILLALAAQASPVAASAIDIPEPVPSQMSKSEIREHNAKLSRDHRYYIRCVKAPDTGSLVARRQTCRTNDQWAAQDRAGEAAARESADEARSRSASSSSN
jgi:hypothetical protein